MARPTTRYERFKATKQKHIARRRRLRHVGFRWILVDGKWKRNGRKKPYVEEDQAPPRVQRFHGQAVGRMGPPFQWVTHVHYNGGAWGMPHARFAHYLTLERIAPLRHYEWPVCWYHVKPGKIVPRRGGQMNALQRRVWGANWFYHLEGMFPADDPLGRQPDELTFDWQNPHFHPEGPWPTIHPWDV